MPKQQRIRRSRFLGSKQGLLFLVFAALIWVLSALSETYTSVAPVHVAFHNDTESIILTENRMEVLASVSASGFSIFFKRLFPRELRLSTSNLPELDLDNPVVTTRFLFDAYRRQYPSGDGLNGFVLSSVRLPITKASVKSFKPVLIAPPTLATGYQLTSPIQLSIDQVVASGGSETLKLLDTAFFELTSNEVVKEDFVLKARLLDSIAVLADWNATEIEVSGQVDRYSDISFVLPLAIQNAPDSLDILLTSTQVTLKFAAPLASLRSINATDFRADVTYDPSATGQLPVRITGLPDNAKQVVVTPPTVSYLISE